LDGEVAGPGAEDETAFVKVNEAKKECGAAADGVESRLVGPVGGKGVVVTVEDCDGSGGDEWVHRGGLLGVGADGKEALPVSMPGGGAGAIVVEARGGDLDGFDDGGGGDAGFVHGRGGGDDGDDLDRIAGVNRGRSVGGGDVERKYLVDGEVLRGEDAVEAFEGECALTVEEVGDVGLLKTSLLGEAGTGKGASIDAAKKFQAKEFVEVLKVHDLGVSMANHIIRQDEDKTKILLYAIGFAS
jgi:hypothetical protein